MGETEGELASRVPTSRIPPLLPPAGAGVQATHEALLSRTRARAGPGVGNEGSGRGPRVRRRKPTTGDARMAADAHPP